MKITSLGMGIVAIIVGVLVLVWPDLIRWFIGVGLIVLGAIAVLQQLDYPVRTKEPLWTTEGLLLFLRLCCI